jgi:regulator of sigma E protease
LPDSPAQEAGLAYGDIIKSINGEETPTWDKMYATIQTVGGQPLDLEVERGERLLNITVAPAYFEERREDGAVFTGWRIGIAPTGRAPQFAVTQAAALGIEKTWRMTKLIGRCVGRLFGGEGSVRDIGGPVLVAQMVKEQADRGISEVLVLSAFLSINLGLLNLLPIPALDGGHVLFCLLEVLFRRPVPPRLQSMFIYAGFGLLITLMVMATAFDIFRILQ